MATAKQIRQHEREHPQDPNVRDPEHAHELGGTLGMTAGGVAGGIAGGAAAITGAAATGAATGALSGAAIGPIGIVAGAAIGGAIGGALGERIAREVNPTAEEKYWEENYRSRPYVTEGRDFDTYRPAYRYGVDAYTTYEGRDFDAIESDLSRGWNGVRGESSLEWEEARDATRDAYGRLHTTETTHTKR